MLCVKILMPRDNRSFRSQIWMLRNFFTIVYRSVDCLWQREEKFCRLNLLGFKGEGAREAHFTSHLSFALEDVDYSYKGVYLQGATNVGMLCIIPHQCIFCLHSTHMMEKQPSPPYARVGYVGHLVTHLKRRFALQDELHCPASLVGGALHPMCHLDSKMTKLFLQEQMLVVHDV